MESKNNHNNHRNPADLDIIEWQAFLNRYTGPRDRNSPPAIRIENTQFTPARYYGGMKLNGNVYTYFEPRDPRQPDNPDGTPYVAWLMVREDFLRWVSGELKKKDGDK